MNRRPSARIARRLVAGLLLVAGPASLVTACGGDDNKVTDAISATDDTVPAGATMPDLGDITLPENLPVSGECAELYQRFITALGSAGTGQSFDGLEEAFSSLSDSVPDDLKDDVETVADAYGQMAAVIADAGGDIGKAMADPANQAKIAAIGTPEVEAASDAISAYFEETCPEMNQS